MSGEKRVAPRVIAHVEALRKAGLETESFFNALIAVRDDSALPNAHREAIYRMVAMESYIWYLEALRGEPVDRAKLLAEAAKIAEQNGAAIKKPTPGGASIELITKDIGVAKGPKPPEGSPIAAPSELAPDGPTKRERIPKVAAEHAAREAPKPGAPKKK